MQPFADISLFEKLNEQSAGHAVGNLGVFNSTLAPVIEEYGTTKRSSNLCDSFLEQAKNEPSAFQSALLDLKAKTDESLQKLRQDLTKATSKERLDDADKQALVGLSENALVEIVDCLQPFDAELVRRFLEKKHGEPANIFNIDSEWTRNEFDKLRSQFVKSAVAELQQYRADLVDVESAVMFDELIQAAVERTVADLTELEPATGASERFEQILGRFSTTVDAAEKTTRRLPLKMPRTREIAEQLRALLEAG